MLASNLIENKSLNKLIPNVNIVTTPTNKMPLLKLNGLDILNNNINNNNNTNNVNFNMSIEDIFIYEEGKQ